MADIDMSPACSKEIGTWEFIGTDKNSFSGTFDGNYHTISNLYIKGYSDIVGLFKSLSSNGTIQNLILENVDIYNSYEGANSYTGGIAGTNYGIIQNCGIKSGTVIGKQVNSANYYKGVYVGGITRNESWIHRFLL